MTLEQTIEKLRTVATNIEAVNFVGCGDALAVREAITALTEAQQREQGALVEIGKWLSHENENVKRGDLIAAIRDLAQVAVSEKGNSETLEAEVARLTGDIHEWVAATDARRALNESTTENAPIAELKAANRRRDAAEQALRKNAGERL